MRLKTTSARNRKYLRGGVVKSWGETFTLTVAALLCGCTISIRSFRRSPPPGGTDRDDMPRSSRFLFTGAVCGAGTPPELKNTRSGLTSRAVYEKWRGGADNQKMPVAGRSRQRPTPRALQRPSTWIEAMHGSEAACLSSARTASFLSVSRIGQPARIMRGISGAQRGQKGDERMI